MGKASKLKKARAAAIPYSSPAKPPPSAPPSDDSDSPELPAIDPIDLEITIETLQSLLLHPEILKTPAHKSTRSLIHKLHGALGGTFSSNSSSSTTACDDSGDALITALRTRDHPRARALLATIKTPKLGSLQRWVRECDAANVASQGENITYTSAQHADQDNETWKTLESIIRTTTPSLRSPAVSNPLIRFPPWELTPPPESRIAIHQLVKSHKLCTPAEASRYGSTFSLLHTIPAHERKPPNLHPALIWTSKPGVISIPDTSPPVTAHQVPELPGALLLQNVFPAETCRAIVAAAETIGFTPDQAAAGSATALASILAHNFYWMADTSFSAALFSRVAPFLPATVSGFPLRSINRRYRCYRYVPGAIYRPHVDGAWPPSGITEKGEYVYDAEAGRQYSRFTFLVYLNDEFEGGETTFFVARREGEGLEARAVRPRMGAVLVFPHGDAEGSLVHEGSPVVSGCKYIIRTDVVYDVPQGGRGRKGE